MPPLRYHWMGCFCFLFFYLSNLKKHICFVFYIVLELGCSETDNKIITFTSKRLLLPLIKLQLFVHLFLRLLVLLLPTLTLMRMALSTFTTKAFWSHLSGTEGPGSAVISWELLFVKNMSLTWGAASPAKSVAQQNDGTIFKLHIENYHHDHQRNDDDTHSQGNVWQVIWREIMEHSISHSNALKSSIRWKNKEKNTSETRNTFLVEGYGNPLCRLVITLKFTSIIFRKILL